MSDGPDLLLCPKKQLVLYVAQLRAAGGEPRPDVLAIVTNPDIPGEAMCQITPTTATIVVGDGED